MFTVPLPLLRAWTRVLPDGATVAWQNEAAVFAIFPYEYRSSRQRDDLKCDI
jgi:hypothetical protein